MIKGINHKIIEITETDNIYYEKAWLVISPQYETVEESILRKEAKKLLSTVGTPSSIKGKRAFGFWFRRIFPSVLAGLASGVILGLLVNM